MRELIEKADAQPVSGQSGIALGARHHTAVTTASVTSTQRSHAEIIAQAAYGLVAEAKGTADNTDQLLKHA